jgi:hypothetical protein
VITVLLLIAPLTTGQIRLERLATHCFVEATDLAARYVDPEKAKGNLPEGEPLAEYVPPPQLPQYEAPIVGTVPSVELPSVEEALRLHSQALDAAERRPRIASASFRSSRSLSRFT